MKTSLIKIALILSSLFSFAQDGITITVTVDNVPNNEGVVSMALHTEKTFMKAAPIQGKSSKIENNKMLITKGRQR